MSDRRRLLVFSVIVLCTVTLAGVGITAYQFSQYAVAERTAGPEDAASPWHAIWLSVLETSIAIVAGGTLLVRVVHPFIRLLQDTKARLEWKAAEMDHFMRALSHDMTANSLLLESTFCQLRDNCGETNAGVKNGLAHLAACLGESQRFLDDLRELAWSGNVQMEPTAVDLAAAARNVIGEQAELLRERNIQIEIEAGLPAAWCNENRVKQVLTNLVRNAAKHGCDPRDPRITIAAALAPANAPPGDFAWLRIHDNGKGIPAEHHQEIFLPGKRLATASPDGTGMGLSIVKKVVDHYGGMIFVDPSTRRGTSFVLGLPQATAEQLSAIAAEQNARDNQPSAVPAPNAKRRHDPSYRSPATESRGMKP